MSRFPASILARKLTCTALAALALVLLPMAGCLSRRAADPNREEHELAFTDQIEWPARITADLDEKIKATPRRITRFVLDGTVPESGINPTWLEAAKRPEGRIVYNRKFGEGLIRIVREGDRVFTRFISYSPLTDRPADQRTPQFIERSRIWIEQFAKSHVSGLKPNDDRTRALLYEGTQLRLREPKRELGKPVGLVIHMAGLGSIEYEQPVLDELQKRGWVVLRIATPSVWWYESKPHLIQSESDIRPVAEQIARTIDDLVAEPAYAAEAALAYLAQTRPDVPQSPLVMVGCSAGALAAPAVVARMSNKFDAVVLVGAGANLLKLSQTSDLTDGGIRISWSNDLGSAADRNLLYRTYLNASFLDPYNTAAAMRHMPVLLVQAALDSTVPAAGGDLLWERLGRPELWTFTGGHRLLFWKLSEQTEAIATWVEAHLPEPMPKSDKRP